MVARQDANELAAAFFQQHLTPGHRFVLIFGGVAALVIGYLILALRGCSVCCPSGFSIIIPIIGWLAVLKGILILVRPQWMLDMTKTMLKENLMKIWAFVILALGLAFSFFGFCPKSPI